MYRDFDRCGFGRTAAFTMDLDFVRSLPASRPWSDPSDLKRRLPHPMIAT